MNSDDNGTNDIPRVERLPKRRGLMHGRVWILLAIALGVSAYLAGWGLANGGAAKGAGFTMFLPVVIRNALFTDPISLPKIRADWPAFANLSEGFTIQYPPTFDKIDGLDLTIRNHTKAADAAPAPGEVTVTIVMLEKPLSTSFSSWLAGVPGQVETLTVVGRPAGRRFVPSQSYRGSWVAIRSYFIDMGDGVLTIQGITGSNPSAQQQLEVIDQMIDTLISP